MIYYNEILNDLIVLNLNPNGVYFSISFERELPLVIQNWEVPQHNSKLEETIGHLVSSGYTMISEL